MNINLIPLSVIWALLAIVVFALIAYRRHVAGEEDDTLRVLEPASVVSHQVVVAQKLEKIDRWGKILTALAVLYGLALAGLYLYQQYLQATNNPLG